MVVAVVVVVVVVGMSPRLRSTPAAAVRICAALALLMSPWLSYELTTPCRFAKAC